MKGHKLNTVLTKEMLEYHYGLEGSLQKVAIKLGISVDSVSKYMQIHNIPYYKTYRGIYTCNHQFFSTDTEISFYLAGFIAADGSLQERKYSKILKITLSNKDRDHLEKLKLLLNSTNPITEYIVKPSKLVPTQQFCTELQIVSEKIFDDLERFNIIPNKTKIYTFPEWLINHPLVHHFMRGYFDGDGCISHCGFSKGSIIRQKSFNILGTYEFIKLYNEILSTNTLTNMAKIRLHNNSIYAIHYSGNKLIQKIFDFLYKDATIYLDRKYRRFLA